MAPLYYGVYQSRFYRITANGEEELDGSPCYLDFRDADYTRERGAYYSDGTIYSTIQVDFYCVYDTEDGRYFQYLNKVSRKTRDSIWLLKGKVQNSFEFNNFKLTTQGITGSPSYTVTINGANHSLTGNSSKSVGVGFGDPVNVTMTIPNRLGSAPPYSYLTTWDGQRTYSNAYSWLSMEI